MKSRRYQKLRRNPFVRLFRMIYRSLKVIFKSRKRDPKLVYEEQAALAALKAQKELNDRLALEARNAQQELENRLQEQFLTVGDLLERVKWQIHPKLDLNINSISPEYDVSRN
jgi:hypothetical protein